MALYEGEITNISAGRDIADDAGRGTRREFIEIGGRRVRNITYSDYLGSFIKQGDGKYLLSVAEVSKSKRQIEPERILFALKLPSGEVVKDDALYAQERLGRTGIVAQGVLLGLLAGLVAAIPGCVVGIMIDDLPTGIVGFAFGAAALVIWYFIRIGKQTFRLAEEALNAFD